MFEELVELLPNFPGKNAHVRCFSHTVNLTAKGVLRPFEPAKPKARIESSEVQAPVHPDDIGLEELYAELKDIEENGDKEKDDVEGFVEVLQEMTEEEREQWKQDVEPVRMALFKVSFDPAPCLACHVTGLPFCLYSQPPFIRLPVYPQARKISFKIINSTTLLLPRWREQVAHTEFKDRTLPRDVATRWNSTYDMLAAFVEMKDPVMKFLDRSSNGMSEYLLDDDEWEAIEGLVSALKVRPPSSA